MAKLRTFVFFLVSFLVIAPVWYWTVAVKRSPISFDHLAHLQHNIHNAFPLTVTASLLLDGDATTVNKVDIPGISNHFREALHQGLSGRAVVFDLTAPDLAVEGSLGLASKTNEEIDTIVAGRPVKKGLNLALVLGPQSAKCNQELILGQSRTAIFKSCESLDEAGIRNAVAKSAELLIDVMLTAHYKVENVVKPASAYHVTFSLLNGDTESRIFTWDFAAVYQRYLAKVFEHLTPLARFTVDSQVVQYAVLNQTKPSKDSKTGGFFFSPKALPYFVNANEWKIDSTSMNESTLNFLLYIPSSAVTPLEIRLADGSASETNGWLIPQFGGAVIFNRPTARSPNASLPVTTHTIDPADLQAPLGAFVAQLRNLLGFHDRKFTAKCGVPVSVLIKRGQPTSPLEVEAIVLRSLIANMANAITTLRSFSVMVESLTNMPIPSSVVADFDLSVESLHLSLHHFQQGDFSQAFDACLKAVRLAEKLFFDKTMLGMLYFPDEHTFAIYVPLFVPLTVPVLMGLFNELKRRRAKKAAAKEKTN